MCMALSYSAMAVWAATSTAVSNSLILSGSLSGFNIGVDTGITTGVVSITGDDFLGGGGEIVGRAGVAIDDISDLAAVVVG